MQKGKKFSDESCVSETNKVLANEGERPVWARTGIIPGLNMQSTMKYGTIKYIYIDRDRYLYIEIYLYIFAIS